MTRTKEVSTLMCSTIDLCIDDSQTFYAMVYQQAIGWFQYLAITRPKISFAINNLAQFMVSPTELHW